MPPLSSLPPTRAITSVSWVLQILLVLAFLAASGAKLGSLQMMVDIFDHIGIGQWFRYVTAVIELVGAFYLLAPSLCGFGTSLLAATTGVDVPIHIFVLHSSPAPALVLSVIGGIIAHIRRGQILAIVQNGTN